MNKIAVILLLALMLMPLDAEAQTSGRAGGSRDGIRGGSISKTRLKSLMKEVVVKVMRESDPRAALPRAEVDRAVTLVEQRLALRAPLRIVEEAGENERKVVTLRTKSVGGQSQ